MLSSFTVALPSVNTCWSQMRDTASNLFLLEHRESGVVQHARGWGSGLGAVLPTYSSSVMSLTDVSFMAWAMR